MNSEIMLDPDLLDRVEPSERYKGRAEVTPSVFDIPLSIKVQRDPSGELSLEFRYPDQEPTGKEETIDGQTPPTVYAIRGIHSGKIVRLRVLPTPEGVDSQIQLVVDRLNQVAPRLSAVNQRLNYRLIANIFMDLWPQMAGLVGP